MRHWRADYDRKCWRRYRYRLAGSRRCLLGPDRQLHPKRKGSGGKSCRCCACHAGACNSCTSHPGDTVMRYSVAAVGMLLLVSGCVEGGNTTTGDAGGGSLTVAPKVYINQGGGQQQQQPQQQYSYRCVTPVTMCPMPQPGPAGGPCWCPTPYGPAQGQIG